MKMMNAEDNKLVFGLDIGTRSIVGTVGYRIGTDRFVVVAQESIEHTTRAVIDGQIHDIPTVADTIYKVKERLEKRVREPLSDVSIAAAGRVLKTKRVKARYQFNSETKVTEDHIRSLDMMGVEQAYDEIRKEQTDSGKKFFCVGYSIVKYYLNGYPMEMIEMHMANYIEVELIATFLPEEVVDGLYSAVELAGLHVASLTLEPIAAINMAIPEKFRLLNIALVDVGAGTSDISIVKDGSIIAFGMIPLAGDEVTEAIAKKYLTDFETAEYIKRACERKKSVSFKDIFGSKIQVTKEDIAQISEDAVKNITKNIADRILELNGGQCVSAVFVVGGGGKHEGFTESLAHYLGLPNERVAIRGAEVLSQVQFEQEGIRTIVSPVETLQICRDKYCFFEHMTEHGIPVLNSYIDLAKFEKAYEAGKIGFPVFVKPVRGAGSVGVMKVSCMELLKALFAYSEEPLLIQEFCNGREFGIDVYVDLVSGEVVDIFAKEKLRMRAGETEKSVTSNDPALKEFVYRAASTLKLSGPVDMDVFEKDGIFYLSEINPRFGGGFPHAYACGVDTPSYILQNLQGIANESHLQEKREEIYVLKYSDILCIDR